MSRCEGPNCSQSIGDTAYRVTVRYLDVELTGVACSPRCRLKITRLWSPCHGPAAADVPAGQLTIDDPGAEPCAV